MSDSAIRRLTTATVLLVATIAAVVSYQHLYHLAITHGETRLDATLLPLSIDGTVVTASLVMLRAARAGLGTPWLARCLLSAAVAMTVAANVAFGWQYAAWGVLMAGWPAAAFLGNAEATISFGRKTRAGTVSPPSWTDAETAAAEALKRTLAAGNPLSANQLATQFRLSRAEVTRVRQAVTAGANGHAAPSDADSDAPSVTAGQRRDVSQDHTARKG